MGRESAAKAEAAARRYYGTGDVDAFYARVWGGEDIHTGVYAHGRESVAAASRRTVQLAAAKVAGRLGPGRTVLDLGSWCGRRRPSVTAATVTNSSQRRSAS